MIKFLLTTTPSGQACWIDRSRIVRFEQTPHGYTRILLDDGSVVNLDERVDDVAQKISEWDAMHR